MFIDYNQNGQFEPSEWTQVYTSATSGTATFTVPLTALGGVTGMRVRSRLAGNINGSGDQCLSMGSGSTDDYYITLGNPPSYSYSWQPGGLTGSSVSVSPSTSTTFTLTVLDGATSCTNTATTSVSLLPPTPGTVSITGGTCGNGSITLNAVNYAPASATIQWDEGVDETVIVGLGFPVTVVEAVAKHPVPAS